MDLQTILTEEEKSLIDKFMNGQAIISRYNEETQQTRYMFKLLGMFYDYTSEGGYTGEMIQIGAQLTGPAKRIALSMVLDGNIRETDFGKYFKSWKDGHLLDLGEIGKICFMPDGTCFINQYYLGGHMWTLSDRQFDVVMLFMKFYSDVKEDMPAGVIRSITETDLAQIEEDTRDPFLEVE